MIQTKNYLAKKELKRERRLAAGLVSDRFPNVSGIVMYMTYHGEISDKVLMIRTVNFFPSSYAFFNMECMTKGCVNGGFDLTPVITTMIKNHKKSVKGKMVCKGKSDKLASNHSRIYYAINIQYKKQSKH
jgi:hypothetical protein